MREKRSALWWLELLFILGMLVVGLMEACSLTFGKRIISLFLWPSVFVGAAVMVYRMISFRAYSRMRCFFLLAAFCVSYGISTIANWDYGYYRNIRILILLAYSFFVVYGYSYERRPEEKESQFAIAGILYLAGCGILSALSFYYLIVGRAEIYYPESGPIYYIGFHWGRLFGVYWDANIGAVMCVFAILLALYRLRRTSKRGVQVLYALYCVFQIVYIAFSGSRTGILSLAAGLFAFLFLSCYAGGWKKALAAGILAAACGLVLLFGTKAVYNRLHGETRPVKTVSVLVDKNHNKKVFSGSDAGTKLQNIDRRAELKGDVSNRRFDIWRSAVDLFLSSPVTGVTHANVLPYVEDRLPDSYLINNSQMMDFDSMHNTFLDILVAQGLPGLMIYLVTGCIMAAAVWLNRRKLFAGARAPENSLYAAGCMMIIIASCVMTEIVYVTSPMSTLFWLGAGCLMMQCPGRGGLGQIQTAPADGGGKDKRLSVSGKERR